MGSLFSCDRCPVLVANSVVAFSDDLIMKLTEGIQPKPLTNEELARREMDDYEWFAKVKCIEQSHSTAYGLNESSFYNLCDSMEKTMCEDSRCNMVSEIKECLQQNSDCPLRCAETVDKYMDCVEGTTLEFVKRAADNPGTERDKCVAEEG